MEDLGERDDWPRQPRWLPPVCGILVLLDLYLSHIGNGYTVSRLLIPIVGVGLLIRCCGDEAAGLRLMPERGWRYWIRIALIFAGIVLVAVLVFAAYVGIAKVEYPIPTVPPSNIGRTLVHACFVAPVVEEGTYRIVLCAALVPLLGTWGTVIVGGLVFSALHLIYGNPGPDNMIAGFLLTWAYLRSRTVLVPWLYHAGGNFLATVSQVVSWYVLNAQ